MAGLEFCGHCGERLDARDHTGCAVQLVMEPPRFCGACDRRMKVQVTPTGWAAECVEHGTVTG
jgi:NADH pyrophosphatase NudC (nudix superfamily)